MPWTSNRARGRDLLPRVGCADGPGGKVAILRVDDGLFRILVGGHSPAKLYHGLEELRREFPAAVLSGLAS
jgi:hypothetical protein